MLTKHAMVVAALAFFLSCRVSAADLCSVTVGTPTLGTCSDNGCAAKGSGAACEARDSDGDAIRDTCVCVRNGTVIGDPHYITWDGVVFDFQAVGEFTLVQTRQMLIQMRTKAWNDVASVATSVAMLVRGDRVQIDAVEGGALRVNGVEPALVCSAEMVEPGVHLQSVPSDCEAILALTGGGRIRRRGGSFTIFWPDEGDRVNVTVRRGARGGWLSIQARTVPEMAAGLLGNGDGDRRNEFTSRDGVVLVAPLTFDELYQQYGESWRLEQAESLFTYASGESTETFTDRSFPSRSVRASDLPGEVVDRAGAVCRLAGAGAPLLDACTLDVGLTGVDAFAEDYARQDIGNVEVMEPVPGGRSRALQERGCGCSQARTGSTLVSTLELLLMALLVGLSRVRRAQASQRLEPRP